MVETTATPMTVVFKSTAANPGSGSVVVNNKTIQGIVKGKADACYNAMSLSHIDVTGSHFDAPMSLKVTLADGTPLETGHNAAFITDTKAEGHHAVCGVGVQAITDTRINLHAPGAITEEAKSKVSQRAARWTPFLGMSQANLTADLKHLTATDHDGNEQTRVLVPTKSDTGALSQLLHMNQHATSGICGKYNIKNRTEVDGQTVVLKSDVDALAATLQDTLAAQTNVSAAGGLMFTASHLGPGPHTKPFAGTFNMTMHHTSMPVDTEAADTPAPGLSATVPADAMLTAVFAKNLHGASSIDTTSAPQNKPTAYKPPPPPPLTTADNDEV